MFEGVHHYQIVVPTLVDHYGDFISYDITNSAHVRMRRSTREYQTDGLHMNDNSNHIGSNHVGDNHDDTEPAKLIFYKLSAYGMDFHFNLTLNMGLVSPRYVLEYWSGSGNVWRRKGLTRACHYVGHIATSSDSRVALSNCFGLVCMFTPPCNKSIFYTRYVNTPQSKHVS